VKDMIAKLYRQIAGTGERQPTIEQVRAALGPSSPCRDLLGRWRNPNDRRHPSFEWLVYLLHKAEQAGPTEPLFRMGAYMKWCRAEEARLTGKAPAAGAEAPHEA
jgi:hypothetical protein